MRILPDQFKAVIFDLDGVLIDSMPHHVRAWQEVFRTFGVELPADELRKHEGEKAKITIGRLAQKHGLRFSDQQLEDLVEQKRQIYRRSAPRGLRPIAQQIIRLLQDGGFQLAIVTGSVRPNLEWTLSPAELAHFQTIVTSDECHNGKPSAEPYLRAAERLHLPPSQCLVIENAPLGVQSAKAAGMKCVAITTTLPAEALYAADWILPDLDNLQVG